MSAPVAHSSAPAPSGAAPIPVSAAAPAVPAAHPPVNASGSTCCAGAGSLTKSTCGLLTWKNPIESAKVFFGIIITLTLFKYVNVVSLVLYASTLVLAASAFAEFVGRKVTGQGLISKLRPQNTTYLGSFADTYASHFVKFVKNFELFLQDVIYSRDVETTAKFSALAFIFYKLTSWFSLWSLSVFFTVVLFTIPPLYLGNKTLIDDSAIKYSKLARDQAGIHYGKARTLAAPHLSKLDAKFAPVTNSG
ncbi:unnamed protein product [Ambrosiozyma monospora]|uniref:Unnamed protein product n=1 Tax=Ambrosiozyma monospora TaxID=43982 RepID=A0ACB5TYM1_AMBMO|nr:unnamed protein product [Ambrosiozyma monospora]